MKSPTAKIVMISPIIVSQSCNDEIARDNKTLEFDFTVIFTDINSAVTMMKIIFRTLPVIFSMPAWHNFVYISNEMKQLIPSFAMLSLIMVSQSCTEEVETIQPKAEIGFTILTSENESLTDLPVNSRLVVNVKSQSGEPVMEFKEVEYQYSGNRFLINKLDLGSGNYTITDFFVLNESDEIIYAVPKPFHNPDNLETPPLNIQFSVTPTGPPVDLNLELLDVRNLKPMDFGYASFKKPGYRLSLMASLRGDDKPATATATILNGNDTIRHYELAAKMNQIAIPAGVTKNYKLVIAKEGYAPVPFELLDLLRNKAKPLKVSLAPAFTMLAFIDFNSSPVFDFTLEGPEGSSITVDWGDGSKENLELNPSGLNLQHTYTADGNHPVTITGDINRITYFYSFYGQGMIDAISFQQLTDLREIRFGLTRGPKVLDLSHNSKLEFVLLSGSDNLEELILPDVHKINSLSLEGPNQMSSAAVDAVIDNIHENAVNQNIMNGSIGLAATWYQEAGDVSLIGPPSTESLEKLRDLRNDYGWGVYPNPF